VIWTDEGKLAAVSAVGRAFGEANDVAVTVQAIPDVRSSFLSANEAGNGPDVLVGAHDWIGQLVANGAIDPVLLDQRVMDQYAPSAIDAVSSGGVLYGVPYGMESNVLYCRTKAVGDATFESIEDAISAGQQAADDHAAELPLAVAIDGSVGSYNLQALFTSAGGYIFGAGAKGELDPHDIGLDSPGALLAAQKFFELGEAGSGVLRTSITGENATSLLTSGKAACLISGPWALSEVRESLGEDFSVQPVPGFEGMRPARPFLGVNAFYVASGADNATLAELFVAGTSEGSVNTEAGMSTMFDESGLLPAMDSVRRRAIAEDPLTSAFAKAAEVAEPMPALPEMDQVFTPSAQAYVSIVGGADPGQTMRGAAASIRRAIEES